MWTEQNTQLNVKMCWCWWWWMWLVAQSSTGIIFSKLTVYSSVSQNIFMDQFRCIKDLHSFWSLSKWSQITSIFTFRKVLIVDVNKVVIKLLNLCRHLNTFTDSDRKTVIIGSIHIYSLNAFLYIIVILLFITIIHHGIS